MIGTSFPEYVFIRSCIIGLRYTTPICLACLLARVVVEGTDAVFSRFSTKVLVGYSLLDALYALFIYYPYNHRLSLEAKHPPLLPRAERRALLTRCLDNVPNAASYLQRWFLGAAESDIRRENVHEFLSWAFFDRHPGTETAAEMEEVDEYIATVEKRIGRPLQPGCGKAKCLRLTLDKIEVRYRSIGWYFIIGLIDLVTHFQLSRQGFRYFTRPMPHSTVIPFRPQSLFAKNRSASQLSYWYRPHTAKNKVPLVFLHGIGIGLWTYVGYLSDLNQNIPDDDQVGVIALEYLPVSGRLTDAPPSRSEFISQITAILDMHGWSRFAVVGHSYGTVLATHMLKSPKLNPHIESIVLIDPVCILLHMPDVAYNFTRRKPRTANEHLLWYFASMDPGVAHCLGRHFFWKDNIAWKEDLTQITENISDKAAMNGSARPEKDRSRRVTVCLAEKDLIVDTPMVLQYLLNDKDWILADSQQGITADSSTSSRQPMRFLERNGIEVLWFDGLDHAQVFDGKESLAGVIAVTRRACAV